MTRLTRWPKADRSATCVDWNGGTDSRTGEPRGRDLRVVHFGIEVLELRGCSAPSPDSATASSPAAGLGPRETSRCEAGDAASPKPGFGETARRRTVGEAVPSRRAYASGRAVNISSREARACLGFCSFQPRAVAAALGKSDSEIPTSARCPPRCGSSSVPCNNAPTSRFPASPAPAHCGIGVVSPPAARIGSRLGGSTASRRRQS